MEKIFQILIIARSHQHKIASAIVEAALSAHAAIGHKINPIFQKNSLKNVVSVKIHRKRAIRKILELLGSFIILYYPYYTVIMWEVISSTILITSNVNISTPNPYFIKLAYLLLFFSPLINAFLYGIQSKMLRTTFRNYLRKHLLRNELNYEIQNRSISENPLRQGSLNADESLLHKDIFGVLIHIRSLNKCTKSFTKGEQLLRNNYNARVVRVN